MKVDLMSIKPAHFLKLWCAIHSTRQKQVFFKRSDWSCKRLAWIEFHRGLKTQMWTWPKSIQVPGCCQQNCLHNMQLSSSVKRHSPVQVSEDAVRSRRSGLMSASQTETEEEGERSSDRMLDLDWASAHSTVHSLLASSVPSLFYFRLVVP